MIVQILLFLTVVALLAASDYVAKKARPTTRKVYYRWNKRRHRKDDLATEYARIGGIRVPMVAIYELPFAVVSAALALGAVGILCSGFLDWYALVVVSFTVKLVAYVVVGIVGVCMTVSWYREYRRLRAEVHAHDAPTHKDK